MLLNPDIPDEKLLKMSILVKGEGAFDWFLQPNPDLVDISSEEIEAENAMKIGNGLCRFRRASRYFNRRKQGVNLPVLVSEGDSWFQFPFLIKEVIDQLEDEYLIWSIGAAGDTAQNMVFELEKRGKTEYLIALKARKKDGIAGFLFSAAGNDIIGEDPETGTAALYNILNEYNGDESDTIGHINFAELDSRMAFLRSAYEKVITSVRNEAGFETLPIFIHGYDYPFPFPYGDHDNRKPSYAKSNEWLGEPLDKRHFPVKSYELRRSIIKVLIDALYDMLAELAGNSRMTKVWVVDCRNAMPEVTDWNDEIHGTSDGFRKVAERFRLKIQEGTGQMG